MPVEGQTLAPVLDGITGSSPNSLGDEDPNLTIYGASQDIKANPNNYDAFISRSKGFVKEHLYERAIDDCNDAIGIAPSQFEGYEQRYSVHLVKGDYSSAVHDATLAIELYRPQGSRINEPQLQCTDLGALHQSRAYAYFKMGNYINAFLDNKIGYLRGADAINSDDYDLSKLDKFDEKQAAKWDVSWSAAQAANKEGEPLKAIQLCEDALVILGDNFDTRRIAVDFELAKAYLAIKYYPEAFALFQHNRDALERLVDKDDLSLAYCDAQIGVILYAQNFDDEALPFYSKAMVQAKEILSSKPQIRLERLNKLDSITPKTTLLDDDKIKATNLSDKISSLSKLCLPGYQKDNALTQQDFCEKIYDNYKTLEPSRRSRQTTDCLYSVTLCYDGQKKYKEAASLLTEVLEDYLKFGVDDPDYSKIMRNVQDKIRTFWRAPKRSVSNHSTVHFDLYSNGMVANLGLFHSSGDWEVDKCALNAVDDASPFARLLTGSESPIKIEFTFDYNVYGEGVKIGTASQPDTPDLNRFQFKPPLKRQRLEAIGPTAQLPKKMLRALDPSQFQPILMPGPRDWLSDNCKSGQSFEEFILSNCAKPAGIRKKIYLQPLGRYEQTNAPPLKTIKQFVEAFSGLEVSILPPLRVEHQNIRTRKRDGVRQVASTDIMKTLKAKLPKDSFLLLGITMDDLYPTDVDWNYVFADSDYSPEGRVAIASLARFDPHFWHEVNPGRNGLLLERSLKMAGWAVCSSLGVDVCTFYRCLMNGCNNLPEEERLPLHLCPVDLRKLQYALGFDIDERYHRLKAFYQRIRLNEEANWVEKKIKFIEH